MVKNSSTSQENLTLPTRHPHPHFHQLNGFIEAKVKKVKATYKKMDGSPNAQARALLQLCSYTTRSWLAITSRDTTWMAHTRSCHALTSQTHQHTKKYADMSTWNSKQSKRTLRSSSQSQGRMSSEGERTSEILSSKTLWHESWNGWQGQWEKYSNEDARI